MAVVTNGIVAVKLNGATSPSQAGKALRTGQTTVYHVADDGSNQTGLAKSYSIYTAGQYSGTVSPGVDNPEYAAATISFTAATKTIGDSANGLATFKTGDTIRVRGSTSNDGVYTVATGNVAGSIVTTEALADEAAAAYITICKRSTPSNACVLDNGTGLMWRQKQTAAATPEKVGPASDGLLVFYDATKAYTLHAAGGDLQMIASPATLRIVGGAGEIAKYFVGMILLCSGFANAANNLPGLIVTTVAVNGADLDISLSAPGVTLVAEAAAGSRAIKVVCQSAFSYLAAMNAVGLGGYTDWRVPNFNEVRTLVDYEAPTGLFDATAFPTWGVTIIQCATSSPATTTSYLRHYLTDSSAALETKATARSVLYVRGGL